MAWVNGMIFAVGQKGELMSDLIDRQAAIDALDRMRIEYLQKGRDVLIMWECEDVLRQLPPAQPEIVRCKDCKWWRRDSDHTCKEHSLVSPMLANDFCSRGERKDHD